MDYTTTRLASPSPITDSEDLSAGKAQQSVMSKATRTLDDALAMALSKHPGSRAASITPRLKAGHPIASIVLLKGMILSTVTVPLD